MRRTWALAAVLIVSVVAARAEGLDPLAPEKIRDLMQDRKFTDVAALNAAFDEAAREKNAPKDYLGYLRGRALHLAGKYDDAIAAYTAAEKEFPESPWLRRIRFARGLAYARKGDFRAAEQIYRQEAEFLLSAERKQELAEIYLEFAQGYFRPAEQEKSPDYAKALKFYSKALELGPEPVTRGQVELRIGQCHQELGQHDQAIAVFTNFVKDHPDNPLAVEAQYRLGGSYMAQGNPVLARRSWQDLLAKFPNADSPRVAESMFRIAETYAAQGLNPQNLSLSVAAYEAFYKKYPAHSLAGEAHLRIAQMYMNQGRPADVVAAVERFLADPQYANREQIGPAQVLLGEALVQQEKLTEALDVWRKFLAQHPTHPQWQSVQQRIIDVEFHQGQFARNEKKFDQARKLWNEFSVKYPLDSRNPAILFELGQMLFEEEKHDQAIAEWRRLVTKYPQSEHASRAQFSIGLTLEEKQSKLAEALVEYRKLNWGSFARHAAQRAARLVAKSMTVQTERAARSDESPRIKLTTRNVESVTIKAYSVDLETYFRKMHSARGVESLDISLIDADKTIEFKVPGYVEHKQIESEVEIPLAAKAPGGVMAVTVASSTLEATTMVVQTDLDIVVKSSRDEVFVFAENLQTGAPWADVRILVSDGARVFCDGVTGKDGVWRHSCEQLASAADVRVFAISGAHTASNVIGLDGLNVAQGLAHAGYLYTDRPAYRAGNLVHVRGVFREVAQDAYRVPAGKTYTIEVYDSRNRRLVQQSLKLSKFGSFSTNFVLPGTAPVGQYRLVAIDESDRRYDGSFTVQEYRLEPVRLSIDLPRTTYYRGEEIEGKIVARFYYGAPLANSEVKYVDFEGRLQRAVTDEQGEAPIRLSTRELSETQLLQINVDLPERNLRTTKNVWLATQEFSISLSTHRNVYVTGETFDLELAVKDMEQQPIGRKLAVAVFKRTELGGRSGQKEIERHEVATDPATGRARLTLGLAEGGEYILRATATDRFENQVTGEKTLAISGDKDQVRLRILADKHQYNVGDAAKIRVHWRDEPALALVTFEGARVLDYRLVTLKKGDNVLAFPMSAALAPNFDLAVAVMTDARLDPKAPETFFGRFHSAASSFSVKRELKVQLSLKRKAGVGDPKPGDEVELAVTTVDSQGQPVQAEVSLALVEQAVIDLFSQAVSPIGNYFRGVRRVPSFRTTSSVTFAYRPATRGINPRLLAEREREDTRAAEEASLLAGVDFAMDEIERPGAAPADEPAADPFSQTRAAWGALPLSGESGRLSRNGWEQGEFAAAYPQNRDGMSGPHRGQQAQNLAQSLQLYGRPQSEMAQEEVNALMFANGAGYNGDFSGGKQQRDSSEQLARNWAVRPNSNELSKFSRNGAFQAQVLLPNGAVTFYNLKRTPAEQEKLAGELRRVGAVLLAIPASETGFWYPDLATGPDGKASLSFTLPEESTAWQLLARGITLDTLAGEATLELQVKEDLFGELKLPASFTDGDTAQVQATLHNDALDKGAITVALRTTIGDKSTTDTRQVQITKRGLTELAFNVKLERPAELTARGPEAAVEFELTVTAGERQSHTQRVVPLLPFGAPVFSTAGGTAESDMTAWVEAPAGMTIAAPGLQVIVGTSVEQSLLDVLLAPAPWCQTYDRRYASSLESAASDLLAAVALQDLVKKTRQAGGPETESLDARIRGAVSLLVTAQADGGGWSWSGTTGPENRFMSARALWALALARQRGYSVPDEAFQKAIGFLKSQLVASAPTDYETNAVLLHALAVAGHGDFALANRLHRTRSALSTGGLAYLALALVEMDRAPMAEDALKVLADRNLDKPYQRAGEASWSLPWSHSPAELRALYGLALDRVSPQTPAAGKLVDWLMAHRTGHRWSPDKATGPAMLLAGRWFAAARFDAKEYKLTVIVNGYEVQTVDVRPETGTQTIDVPIKFLNPDKQRVQFQLTGRGQYSFQCIYGGFVAADKLKSTTGDFTVERFYQPAPLEFDGRPVDRGFGVLQGNYTTFRNPLTQLPVARKAEVALQIARPSVGSSVPDDEISYLVVTEPIPAGATVVEASIKGGFERYEIGAGEITFYIGSRRYVGNIRYDLYGYLPGEYRVAPTIVRNVYRPEMLAVAAPARLDVLKLGQVSEDEYRLTPQELYHLGQRHFERGEWAQAQGHLTNLFTKWNLRPEIYKETARMLLDTHLQLGPAHQIVKYFEIIKEKWPELEITFDKIVKVGAAYDQIGEYERSYLVFRATVESSFQNESGVAGFLDAEGEFLKSVDVMSRVLAAYPPEPYLASAQFALAQRVYEKAPRAAEDPQLKERKINRVTLLKQALRMVETFLTAFPEDPAADQAAFSEANALLDLEDYARAAAQCRKYAERYPKSDFLTSYWYVVGYCHFARGEHEQALEMCRKVAEAKVTEKATGRTVDSPNKWRAIYILGQVYHSLGQAAQAIDEYARVKDRFADADEAIEYFTRKEIDLPEVTTVAPGKPAAVELKYRNVAKIDATVYRIDLMKYSLLQKNLGGITGINLSGIRPFHQETFQLGDGKDYRDKTRDLNMPIEDEGAYLVVCRGGDLHATGLVLVTPLSVEVDEDAAQGRVRTTIRDKVKDKYLSEVHVKVIGSSNPDFVSGETDLRGVFVADEIRGRSTVIARAESGQYAFHRGTIELGPPPPAPNAPPQTSAPAQSKPDGKSAKNALLKDLQLENDRIQQFNRQNLERFYNSPSKGVEIQKAF